LTRKFDIGPYALGVGALALLVSLFLTWFDLTVPQDAVGLAADVSDYNAWRLFEITDLLLAGLAIAALIGAIGLITPSVDLVDRRFVPWIVGAAFVLVANQLIRPQAGFSNDTLGFGAWLALAATVVMAIGAVLSLTKVSFAVAVEGRDRRRRVSAVDHRPPPTETGAPVARSSTSLLHPEEPEAGEKT
jgi:hypothetical protein